MKKLKLTSLAIIFTFAQFTNQAFANDFSKCLKDLKNGVAFALQINIKNDASGSGQDMLLLFQELGNQFGSFKINNVSGGMVYQDGWDHQNHPVLKHLTTIELNRNASALPSPQTDEELNQYLIDLSNKPSIYSIGCEYSAGPGTEVGN